MANAARDLPEQPACIDAPVVCEERGSGASELSLPERPPVLRVVASESPLPLSALAPADLGDGVQELYEGAATTEHLICREAASRVRLAIRNNEFRLYCKSVRNLVAEAFSFHEIVIRQVEEEQNMMPPGAFFALAEECALMPELDRWVVTSILEWILQRRRAVPGWKPSMYCINVSRETISDPFFPEFVMEQSAAFGVPAESLCLELQESDVLERRTDTAAMVEQLRGFGLRMMLGGFGRDKLAFDILKHSHFDFLKIDGALILNILRNDASLARLRGILRVASTVGISTVADLVESEEIIARLRELGVNYAQGSAISGALPLVELE